MEAKYELVVWNETVANAVANLYHECKPDCHTHVSWHKTPEAAIRALDRCLNGRIRVNGEPWARVFRQDIKNLGIMQCIAKLTKEPKHRGQQIYTHCTDKTK